MKDYIRKNISLLVLFICICFSANSQNGNPLQFLSEVSQSSRVNPAFQNKSDKLVFGMPILSGFKLNWIANFAMNDFSTDQFSFDYENFYNSLDGPGKAFSMAEAPLFFLTLRNKNQTFSFSIYERIISSTNFDREILNFYAQGLQAYYGKNENIGSFSLKANYFRELSFAYSNQIGEKLSIGIRPKILFGKFFYKIDNVDLRVETIDENKILLVKPEGKLSVSGPLKVVFDEENEYESVKPDVKASDYFFKPKNMGAGVDLGISYTVNKDTKVSLAILDIGFTSLNYQLHDIVFDESLNYHKDSLYQSHNPQSTSDYITPQNAFSAMNDSIPYITNVIKSGERRIEALPLQTNIEITYKLKNNLKLGFSNHFTYYKQNSSNYFTGALISSFNNKIDAVATISLYNLKKVMPGIGASFTGKNVQFYLSTNNIVELLRPTSAKSINLCFGVNFLFSTD